MCSPCSMGAMEVVSTSSQRIFSVSTRILATLQQTWKCLVELNYHWWRDPSPLFDARDKASVLVMERERKKDSSKIHQWARWWGSIFYFPKIQNVNQHTCFDTLIKLHQVIKAKHPQELSRKIVFHNSAHQRFHMDCIQSPSLLTISCPRVIFTCYQTLRSI